MLESFKNHINQNLPFLKSGKLLIAISGGVDSVVLAHLSHLSQLNFSLAHCNFKLRGEESDKDEDFVLQLANDLNVEVFVQRFDTKAYAGENKLSIQMAARELRYDWFNDLTEQLKFNYILTAHHTDDNVETFLINLSRGTGLDGLTGIPEVNDNVVRPLLKFSRLDIENYAKENNLKWREDNSNASTKYLRNKLRHEVIPILKETNPSFLQSFSKTQSHLNASKQIIEDAIAKVQKKVVKVEGEIIKVSIKKIRKLSNPKVYLYELLKDFGFPEWNDVEDLLHAQSGKQLLSETHRLIKDRDFLLLTENELITTEAILITKKDAIVKTSLGTLSLESTDQIEKVNEDTIYVDRDKLKFPLTIRAWQKGDYFYPLGMKGKKKLSKYFKDEKFSLLDKENALVLCSENDIVWIVNRRADNRFKITANTKQILKIKLE